MKKRHATKCADIIKDYDNMMSKRQIFNVRYNIEKIKLKVTFLPNPNDYKSYTQENDLLARLTAKNNSNKYCSQRRT